MSKKEIVLAVVVTAAGYAFYDFIGRPLVSYVVGMVRGMFATK